MPLAVSLAGVLLGIGLILIAGAFERRAQSSQVWKDALVATEGEPPWDGALPIRVRPLPDTNLPDQAALRDELGAVPGGDEAIAMFGLDSVEPVVAVDLPDETWAALVESGRAPEPGAPEALAGALARLDAFEMDGVEFRVVGRLQRGTGGLAFAFLVREGAGTERHFTEQAGATSGWLDPEGVVHAQAISPEDAPQIGSCNGLAPTGRHVVVTACVGFMLALVFGAVGQVALLRRWAKRPSPFRPILAMLDAHPRTLWAIHGLHYGVFGVFMALAVACPRANMRLLMWVTDIFTTGNLSAIGSAYLAQNVPNAAWQTFLNNYVRQTLLLSIAPSVFLPVLGSCFALVKTLLSFSLVGFVMAPIWVGMVEVFAYHAVTGILELEAYVLVSFMIVVLPVRLFQALGKEDVLQELAGIARMIASGTVLAGIMLAVAAAYEAMTLVWL
ncbi:MAG: stage II sporulation protein M [Candidatus Hydrogenedentes bacterium]|nr:stage II sporulation protein M [Candidatus Hydrogenedentota bacterium]